MKYYYRMTESIAPEFGKLIRTQREKLTMSQEDVGSILALSRVAIANFESGRNLPTLSNALALCKLLQIPFEKLEKIYDKCLLDEAKANISQIYSGILDLKEIER